MTPEIIQRILEVDIPDDKKIEIMAILSGKKPRSKGAIRQERYMAAKKAKEIADAENDIRFDAVQSGKDDANPPPPPSLSPTPPIPPATTRTHTPAYMREDPCTLEEAQKFALGNGIYMNAEGVEYWHGQRSKTGWMIHHQNGTSTPIPDWKKDMRGSTTWVREKQAELKTKELRLQREQSYADAAPKPKKDDPYAKYGVRRGAI